MRVLLTSGDADSGDVRMIEDIVAQLGRAPDEVWGMGDGSRRRWRPRLGRARRA